VEYSNDTFNQLLAWLGSHVLTKDGVKMFIARIEKKANDEPIRSAVKSLRRADALTARPAGDMVCKSWRMSCEYT
jgi:hypothetical protein